MLLRRLPLSHRSLVTLAVAVLAGVMAAWAAQRHIQGRIQQIEDSTRVQTIQRIVAAFDLPVGTVLDADHLAVRAFPYGAVSSDSLTPEHFTQVAGLVLRSPLRAGDPLLPVHTHQPRGGPFSDRLGPGRRAVTMPVDALNSASGLLEPGDLIDLYVSFEYQRRRITAPLLQGVLVLATGTSTDGMNEGGPETNSYSTVTLDTSPEDAVKLVAARQSGHITALLRRPDDAAPTQKAVRGDLASLLGVNSAPAFHGSRRAPVIYGDRPTRRVDSLAPKARTASPNGVFDLPTVPELVSAWMSTQRREPSGSRPILADYGSDPAAVDEPLWDEAGTLSSTGPTEFVEGVPDALY